MKQKKLKKLIPVGISTILVLALIQVMLVFSASAADTGMTASEACADGTHVYGSWSFVDDDVHSRTCSKCGAVETAVHKGGSATYTDCAVCTDCGSAYGAPATLDLKIDIPTITLERFLSVRLKAIKNPSSNTEKITWSSSKPTIADVDANGKVTAYTKGKAVITATSESGAVATCAVTVVDPMKTATSSITINQPSVTLVKMNSKPNPAISLTAKIVGGSAGKVWYSTNPAVATCAANGRVTAVSEGTALVYCRTADNTVSAPCVVTVKSFCITGSTMTNYNETNVIYVNQGETCTVGLDDTAGLGEGAKWTLSPAKVATMSGSTITGVLKGTATLTVASADKKTKDTCKVIVVAPSEKFTLNKTDVTLYEKATFSFKATMTTKGSNEPVIWTSSNPTVAKVNSKGKVTAVKQGVATITATTFNGKTAVATVLVKSKAVDLVFSEITPALYEGGKTGKFTLDIKAPAGSNDNIVWTTSNKKVINIVGPTTGNSITIVSGVKGTANITAKTGGGKKIVYKVTSVNKPAESVTLKAYTADVFVGKNVTLKMGTRLPKDSNDPIVWKSSDPSIATVDQNGKVTGLKQGEVDIDATTFGGVPNKVHVIVRTKAELLMMKEDCPAIYIGETDTATVEAYLPGCNDSCTWATSNKKALQIVSLSPDTQTATMKALSLGKVKVTVKSSSGKKLTFNVVCVDERSTSMTVNTPASQMFVDDTATLSATLSPEAPYDHPIWRSSDPTVLEVDKYTGKVTALKPGTANIIAGSKLKGVPEQEFPVTVCSKNTAITLNKTAADIYVGENESFTVTSIADGPDTVTWTTSDSSIATVSAAADGMSATVTAVDKGEVSIRAIRTNGDIAEVKVTVRTKITEISFNGILEYSDSVGSQIELSIYTITPADSNDTLTWTSSDESIATVDNNGVVTTLKGGKTTITVTSGSGVSASFVFVSYQEVTNITLDQSAVDAYVGETVTLSITDIAPADYTEKLEWSVLDDTVAAITPSADGKSVRIKGLKVGTTTVKVSTLSGASAAVVVTVKETNDNDADWPWETEALN